MCLIDDANIRRFSGSLQILLAIMYEMAGLLYEIQFRSSLLSVSCIYEWCHLDYSLYKRIQPFLFCCLEIIVYLCSCKTLDNSYKDIVTMKRILLTLLCAVALSLGAWAQVDEVVAKINKDGVWKPQNSFLMNMESTEQMIAHVYRYNPGALKNILNDVEGDHTYAQKILQTRDEIIGKTKKQKKQNKLLAKYFNDVDQARQSFVQAEETEKCFAHFSGALNGFMEGGSKGSMPSGALKYFHYSISNGFAGFREEYSLRKDKGKNILKIMIVRRMSMPEDPGETKYEIEVDDSVFQRVRDMVEEGMLYDVYREYHPEIMVMDASG